MIAWLMLILSFVCAEEIIYEGLRVDISALTFNRDILSCIKPAMSRTLKHNFKSLYEHKALTSLYIKNIKITKPVISENLFDVYDFNYNAPIYQLNGRPGCIYFHLSFSYSMTFLGLTITSGTGTGIVMNKAEKIYVFFNETHPDVQIPHPWDVSNIIITSKLISPKKWIEELLEDKFIREFHEVVDEAMFDFADKLLYTYEYIEDVFGDDYDLIVYNTILDVKPTITMNNYYISIGFDTNITVNGSFVRKMYRRMTGNVAPSSDFSFCLAAEILPDTLDALSKAEYNQLKMEPTFWGFDNNTVSALYNILPKLSDIYKEDDPFIINCKISEKETVNDLAQRGSSTTHLEMQIPYFCEFAITEVPYIELTLDIYVRFIYNMDGRDQTYKGLIDIGELYGFATYPSLPDPKMMTLLTYVGKFVTTFEKKGIEGAGIKVVPNRKDELDFFGYHTKEEEICFEYNEKKN